MNIPHRFVAVALYAIGRVSGNHRFDRHFIHRQGAGFIRADDRHCAQRFHRRQLANDGLATRHGLYAKRKDDGNDGRQAFRHGGNGEADKRQHQFRNRHIPEQEAKDKQRHHHHQDSDEDGLTELIHLHHQRRAVFFNVGHHLIDVAQLGLAPGCHHHAFTAAGADGGA